MAVAEGFARGGKVGNLIAAQQVPQAVAEDATPRLVQCGFAGVAEDCDAADADRVQARLHAAANAGEVAELEGVQNVRQLVMLDDDEAVGLAHFAGDFGQIFVRSGTDAHLDDRRHVAGNGSLDLSADGLDGGGLPQVVRQPGPHLVNTQDGLDVDAVLDRRDDAVVEADVFRRFGLDDGDAGAQEPRLADAGAGFHAERLGLIAGGNAARGFGQHRRDAHRSATQGRIEVLLDRREVGIAVDEQGCKRTLHNGKGCTGRDAGSNGKWINAQVCNLSVTM